MKQKLIYTVLLVAAVYMPAASKECGKLMPCVIVPENQLQVKETPADNGVEVSALPLSPFSRLLFNM